MVTVGENIRAYRKKAGLSQRELADRIGVLHQQIGQYENNVRTPKMDRLIKIADALNVPVGKIAPWEAYTAEMDFFEPVIEEVQKKLPAGYTARSDADNLTLWLEYPDGGISNDLSVSDVQAAINKAMDYLKYELEQFRKGKA